MAKEEATLIIKVKDFGSKVLKGFRDRFVITAGDVARGVAGMARAFINGISEMVNKASETKEVQKAFRSLAAAQGQDAKEMLANMKKLSDGTVSNLELMKQANNALLLGLPVDRFGDMLQVARSASKATGQSMQFMLQSIVTGLGRGCVDGSTLVDVLDQKGKLKRIKIEELYKDNGSYKILALGQNKLGCGFLNYLEVQDSGDKHCIIIKTKGRDLTLTPDHLIFTEDNQWVAAGDSIGKKIALYNGFNNPLSFFEVLSIEDVGIRRTYDIVNCETSSFVANDIVIHNSKLILDNLGILVNTNQAYKTFAATLGTTAEKLTEAQKKQAFINEALRIGKKNAESAGDGVLSYRDRLAQLGATSENIKVALGDKLLPLFNVLSTTLVSLGNDFERFFQSDAGAGFFATLSSGVANAVEGFILLGRNMGTVLGTIVEASAAALTGNFSKAKDIVKLGLSEIEAENKAANQRAIENEKFIQDELTKIQQEGGQTRKDNLDALKEEEKIKAQEAEITRKEEELIAFDEHTAILMAKEEERALMATEQQIKHLDDKIKNETDFNTKKALLAQKAGLLDQKRQLQLNAKEAEADDKAAKLKLANQQSTFGKIASLSSSNNSTLAAIGKGAALTSIAIDAPVAYNKALAAFPPPFNFAAAALVGAASAAQAARVSGIQLAEGGIVQARPGGIQATIGEGGRDEAVIPLDDEGGSAGGLGGGNTFIFNGAVMGDAQQAKEFAVQIDQELLELRRSNESVAFEDVI